MPLHPLVHLDTTWDVISFFRFGGLDPGIVGMRGGGGVGDGGRGKRGRGG